MYTPNEALAVADKPSFSCKIWQQWWPALIATPSSSRIVAMSWGCTPSKVNDNTLPSLLSSDVSNLYECPSIRFIFGSLTYTSEGVPFVFPVVTFAAVVVAKFLLTDESSWITGQIFGVDGGRSSVA